MSGGERRHQVGWKRDVLTGGGVDCVSGEECRGTNKTDGIDVQEGVEQRCVIAMVWIREGAVECGEKEELRRRRSSDRKENRWNGLEFCIKNKTEEQCC